MLRKWRAVKQRRLNRLKKMLTESMLRQRGQFVLANELRLELDT